jgi:pyrroloquinoline quinone (PQQ) biosynthesis protein C
MYQARINEEFVVQLSNKALVSNAVKHPYLEALSIGSLPNMRLALQDFAYQYSFYSAGFVGYLKVLIDQLPSQNHKDILLENVAEENGNCHGVELPDHVLKSIEGVPHSLLYKRFQEAIGIDDAYRSQHRACETAILWRAQFSHLCRLSPETAIGALGMGTELIVHSIYDQILSAIKQHTSITLTERVFFDLHSQCDDEHAEAMQKIAQDLAVTPEACEKIEFGTYMAINLRSMFWNKMYQRALSMPKEQANVEVLHCV